jgi:DsbC/DsbD-like thiol-disulfide interchange protein
MDDGWKTYWRNPGESGVPPQFDWSGSTNLKEAKVLYPAPHRFADANSKTIGYSGDVIFPVKLIAERPGEPIELKLAFEYGLCKNICIPNEVSLNLVLVPGAGKGDAMLLDSALALVPKPAAPGVLPSVGAVAASLDAAKPEIVVDAVFASDARGTDLFIDGGETFVPVPMSQGPAAGGKQRFVVSFATPAEAVAIKGKPLTLTLVSDRGSTETVWTAN